MPVLSNNGRLISSLPVSSQVLGNDELLIQSNGVTKRITYSVLTSSILSSNTFNPYGSTVDFRSSSTNKFSGSFYSQNNKLANFAVVNVRQGITVAGLTTLNTVVGSTFNGNFVGYLTGDVTGNVIGKLNGQVTGSMTGSFTGSVYSTGKSTFSNIDVNGGTIDGTIIGASSAVAVTGTTITANTGFVGNLTGNITGDVYNSTATKVLESGNTTPTVNGGVASAFFYGTSSYGIQALTAAYALAGGGAAVNGLPTGGTQYQILAKKTTGVDYDVIWTNPITRSGSPSQYEMTMWNSAFALKTAPGFSYSAGSDLYVYNKSVNTTCGVTGSLLGVVTSPDSNVNLAAAASVTINADVYPSSKLTVNGTGGTVTINLKKGKTCTVYVNNTGAFTITTWNASINGGVSTTTIYWPNGTPPTITSGGKDVFTFTNVDNNVFGSVIQNFI